MKDSTVIFHRFDSSDEVCRYDFHSLGGKVKVTSQGFLEVPANLTRAGVFEYNEGGKVFRELRHPQEVLKKDSIESLKGAVITIGHKEMINPSNVSSYSVGYIKSTIKETNNIASGKALIQRQDAIDKIKNKELVELSPGYKCRIDNTPGVWEGQHYDRIQRNISYNHIALLPIGDGRQGSEIAIKLDKKDALASRTDNTPVQRDNKKEGEHMDFDIIRVTLDGIAHELRVPKGTGAMTEAAFKKADKTRQDALTVVSTQEGVIEVMKKEQKELHEKLDEALKPEAIQARVDERLATVEKAKKLAPGIDCSGKSLQDIKKEALIVAGTKQSKFDGKDDAYVDGMFAATPLPVEKETSGGFPGITPEPKVRKTDSKDEVDKYDSRAAYKRMCERNRNAWKGVQS